MLSKTLILTVFLVVAFSCSAARCEDKNAKCDDDCQGENNQQLAKMAEKLPTDRLIEPLIHFTGKLVKQLKYKDDNIIISPISIHCALSQLSLAAQRDTVTEKELIKALGYSENATQQELDTFHSSYKSVIENFKEINRIGMNALNKSQTQGSRFGHAKKPPVVDFYNTIIVKSGESLKKQFSDRSLEYYKSLAEPIDPKKKETVTPVVEKINKWGKEAGFQSDILSERDFTNDFSAILISAVRLQAFWFDDFYEGELEEVFHNFGIKSKPVKGKSLANRDIRGKLIEFSPADKLEYKWQQRQEIRSHLDKDSMKPITDLNFRLVELPLQGDINMVIIEPKDAGQGGELVALSEKLLTDPTMLARVLGTLDTYHDESSAFIEHFRMPKFSFEKNLDLIQPLKSLGLKTIFERSNSDLSEMMEQGGVSVDKVTHQAMIEVTKYGIKAAGVTVMRAVAMSLMTSRNAPINIYVENPFMYMIRLKKLPLFFGQVLKLD